jgi:hypothetical protein
MIVWYLSADVPDSASPFEAGWAQGADGELPRSPIGHTHPGKHGSGLYDVIRRVLMRALRPAMLLPRPPGWKMPLIRKRSTRLSFTIILFATTSTPTLLTG